MSRIPEAEVLETVAETAARRLDARSRFLAAIAKHEAHPSEATADAVREAQRVFQHAVTDVEIAKAFATRNGVPL